MTGASRPPGSLILARSEAFCRGDFTFIYDSYHSQSNFRRQFTSRQDYLQFSRSNLAQDYRITRCRVLAERVVDDEAQVIFLMEMTLHGVAQRYAELAWLRREQDRWRYHRGQKMTADELPDDLQTLGFADFARLDPATIF